MPDDPFVQPTHLEHITMLAPEIDYEAIYREEREQTMVDHGYAHVMYERLMHQIHDFESSLNADEEIAAYLSSFGATKFIQIEKVGYHNPFFIVFYGRSLDDNRKVQLVQHTTQLNVLFTSVKLRVEDARPARRIGFLQDDTKA